ncbi:hypothetical protein N1851_006496 [Merluccius polli]|uniref:Uncharacterized protein n=1 Tax=Merluccius polli TaxID=89951 RepID=A0AA47P626_MERPO|nr:hypothetical protein N1851_006496 [Merluccius polli]
MGSEEARQLGRGGRRGTIPPISSWSMGPWAPGPLAEGRLAWAAPGWIRGRLAADGCRWRSLRCLPAPPLAVAAVQGGLVLGWLSSPQLVAPVQLGQPFRVPSWSEEPHVGRQCGRVCPDHTPPKWLSFGALRHRTRVDVIQVSKRCNVEHPFTKVHSNVSQDFPAGSSLGTEKVKELKTTDSVYQTSEEGSNRGFV